MKIKIGSTELVVREFYPFRYADGKLVLRFEVKQSDMDFQELRKLLQNNQNPIEFYEKENDSKPACVYYGYSEFTVQYEQGKYYVEQITPSTLQSTVESLQIKVKEQDSFLSRQEELIQNQSFIIDTLIESILEMSIEIYSDEKTEVVEKEGFE